MCKQCLNIVFATRISPHLGAPHLAAAQGHKLTLELLIARGGGVNASGAGGETPLGVAAARGDSHAASHLLAAGAHPQCADRSGWTPMHSALWRGPWLSRLSP